MLCKRPHPMIGRLSESLVSGNRTGLSLDGISTASIPSPRSPLIEFRIQSPRGLKNYDLGGGVGLGIVAALEKSSSKKSLTRSDPIPVGSCKVPEQMKGGGSDGMTEMETESLEENYTYVTSHRPEKTFTKVYYDAGEYGKVSAFSVNGSMLKESPCKPVGDVSVYPTSDFLNSCHLCKKKLDGKDIYMYRGEKAFCSVECRSRQIMVDEHRDQCRSEVVVPRSVDVSSSPYTASPVFLTGILAI